MKIIKEKCGCEYEQKKSHNLGLKYTINIQIKKCEKHLKIETQEYIENRKKEKDSARHATDEILCTLCGSLMGYGSGDLNCCYFKCNKCK